MKIEIEDERAPSHWRELQRAIERDRELRPDVKLVVRDGERLFLDEAGSPLPIKMPENFSDAKLCARSARLNFIVWLWWTFPREGAA